MTTKTDYQKRDRAYQTLNKNLRALLKSELKDWKPLVREIRVQDWGTKDEHRVVFVLNDSAEVSFDLLAKASKLFKTKKINVRGGSQESGYSEYTYDPAMPTEIHILSPDLSRLDEHGLLTMNWR